jgi:NAD-dependent DNA ligase
MKAAYTKRRHNQFVVYDTKTGKILRTKIDGISVQLVYTNEVKAQEVVDHINKVK